MLALILVAVAVGVSNLAASVGLGAGGVNLAMRLRVVVIFGLLEAGMPVLGLLLGHRLAAAVGHDARWLAACLLVAVGGYGIAKAARESKLTGAGQPDRGGGLGPARPSGRRQSLKLLAAGVALSMDNLVAGFALGAYQVGLVSGAVVFGVVSTAMSLAGLELGALIGKRVNGRTGDLFGGAVLIGVGVAIGAGVLG